MGVPPPPPGEIYCKKNAIFGNEGELSLIVNNFFLWSILVPSPTAVTKWR